MIFNTATSESQVLSIVYVLTNPAMPGLVKIGRTSSDDAKTRIAQLYTTGVPFPFTIEFACRVPNPEEVERALHTAFAPQRVNARREFFQIDPVQAIAILKLLHVEEATTEIEKQTDGIDEQEVAAGETYRKRRPNLDFNELGVPIGAVLQSTATDDAVTVSGPKKVTLNGEEMSLTAATRKVLQLPYSVAPGPYWQYDGRLIRDIYDETYPVEE